MNKNILIRKRIDLIFMLAGYIFLMLSLGVLCLLIFDLIATGGQRLGLNFVTEFPSRFPEKAGILSAWVGSFAVMLTTALIAIPIGIAAAVYLEEYASKNMLTAFIELNIINLAAIPSIVYGLMALGLFVYKFGLGQSILSAGLTLALLILPIVIVTTREALRTVPKAIREAAYALGASQWQTIWNHLLPYSMGGILTGIIIALSRAIGETAPLITIGALTFIAFLPASPFIPEAPFISFQWLLDPFTVLPIQMFNWTSRPQQEFHVNAAATGLVLLAMTLVLNGFAIYLRAHFRRKYKW
jgi:phosphate transport system permease protein